MRARATTARETSIAVAHGLASEPALLDRFNTYTVKTPDFADGYVRQAFPELRGFGFSSGDDVYLRSNSVYLQAWRFGTVVSSGHWISLNDEARVCILLPDVGRIGIEQARGAEQAERGALLRVGLGARRTIVGADYRGYVVLVPKVTLTDRLHMISPDMRLSTLEGIVGAHAERGSDEVLRRHLLFLLHELDRSDAYLQSERLATGILATLADLMAETWLARSADAGRLEATPSASLRQVERAEAYMRERLCDPISIGDVAAELGIGARALQLAFRRFRNTTPLGFLGARRLELMHARLATAQPGETVTSICLECGMGNPGRVADRYRATFGEPPSATLLRAREGKRPRAILS